MTRRIRMLQWLLWWLRFTLWIALIGGTIAFLSMRAGQVIVGIVVGMLTLAAIVAVTILRARDLTRIRAKNGAVQAKHTTLK